MANRDNRAQKGGGTISSAQTIADPAPPPPAAAAAEIETPRPKSDNSAGSAPPPLDVRITLVCGGLTNVKAPVVIGARYDGLAFAGPTKAFDRALDCWLTRAVDLGIIGSALGQLFPIDLQQYHKAGKLKADILLLAGMGEPGRFAQDSLQFLFSNIIVAVKTLGQTAFATSLLGTRRNELPIGQAVRGFVQGIGDGFDRLRAITDNLTEDKEALGAIVRAPLSIVLVHQDSQKLQQIEQELNAIANSGTISTFKLSISRGSSVDPDPQIDSPADAEPDNAVTYLRITQSKSAGASAIRSTSAGTEKPRKSAEDPFPTDVFQFSALSDIAVVPQREQEVNSHLLSEIANRLSEFGPNTPLVDNEERARRGYFFANLVIPDDFRKLIEGPASVTIEVDDTTAAYPWEMAGCRKLAGDSLFVGTNVAVSRQFRTLLSPPPTSPPALNNTLNVLIIADPAAGKWSLPGARREAEAVVKALQTAQDAWGDQYEVKATVRVGSCKQRDDELLHKLKQQNDIVKSVDCCDPVELATLLVNDQYDVVHYAGHGMCDPRTRQTGWVFAKNCILTAKEIFRVRQVPRLVFANACFSSVTTSEHRQHMASMAQAFFGRGIPNYIGAGWEVDDDCAVECARSFYACVMGLRGPDPGAGISVIPSDATIGRALLAARTRTWRLRSDCPSWGAYQHYGHIGDRLVSMGDMQAANDAAKRAAAKAAVPTLQAGDAPSVSPAGPAKTETAAAAQAAAASATDDRARVVVNGINFRTGTYAVPPQLIDDIAGRVRARPGVSSVAQARGARPRSFALPFGVTDKLEHAGWDIVLPAGTPAPVLEALQPLIDFRKKQVGDRLKVRTYNGEQMRDWLGKQGVSPGNLNPGKLPYYLLLVGSPQQIPFEFQYLLGVEYAVGRLAFDDARDYKQYVASLIEYESGNSVPNAKQISYWGTRHSGDEATKLSATFLINPLANGTPEDADLGQPVNKVVKYGQQLFLAKDATKANLLATLHAAKPPALLFTASHGMAFDGGDDQQLKSQGALLCQDWPAFSEVKPEHFLAAADVGDDANVSGMVAFLFACYGAGTPDKDQFLMDLSAAGSAPPPAPKPFIAALPQRLLAHPKGGALAVIGHVDRAWGFSMQAPNVSGPQIETFRNSLESILSGTAVGHAVSERFGARYAELSALLLNQTSPTTVTAPPSDADLVSAWLERNDAQNYVLLGDPAARIRQELLT